MKSIKVDTTNPKRSRKKTSARFRIDNLLTEQDNKWMFAGQITNILNGFSDFSLGSVKKLKMEVPEEHFAKKYIDFVCVQYGLTNMETKLLYTMYLFTGFSQPFKWTAERTAFISEQTEYTPITVNQSFRSLVKKNIIARHKGNLYSMNSDMIATPTEVANADFIVHHFEIRATRNENTFVRGKIASNHYVSPTDIENAIKYLNNIRRLYELQQDANMQLTNEKKLPQTESNDLD